MAGLGSSTTYGNLRVTGAVNLDGMVNFSNTTAKKGLFGIVGTNDTWFIGGGATASNAGYLEIATGDDGNASGSGGAEPIYARQYGPGDPLTGTLVRTASLLDGYGNTSFPGVLTGATLGVNQTAGTGAGVSLYGGGSSGTPEYGIMFAGTGVFGTHGGVSGDWATYLTMTGSTSRGWVFRASGTNVASISGTGLIYAGSTIYAAAFRGNANVSGTGEAIHAPAGIYSTGTNWLYGSVITNGNYIDAGGALVTCGSVKTGSYRITASADAPGSPSVGDVWIDV